MPKLLPDIREKLLETAGTELRGKGIDGLQIRDIAKKCQISAGTVYNYFPSKEMLAASVMLIDWERILLRIKAVCETTASVEDGLRELYGGIIEFMDIYSFVQSKYAVTNENVHFFYGRHERLVVQLSGIVAPLLERYGFFCTKFPAKFVSENILIAATDKDDDFTLYLAMIMRALQGAAEKEL